MSWLPKKNCQGDGDSIDEDIPTIDLSSNDLRRGSLLLHVDQNPVPVPSEQEIIETQAEDPYYQNIRTMIGTKPLEFFQSTRAFM